MTGTYAACLYRNQSRSYLNHLVLEPEEGVIRHSKWMISKLLQDSCHNGEGE